MTLPLHKWLGSAYSLKLEPEREWESGSTFEHKESVFQIDLCQLSKQPTFSSLLDLASFLFRQVKLLSVEIVVVVVGFTMRKLKLADESITYFLILSILSK